MPEQVIALPSQPNVSSPDRGAFVASREDAPAYWFYGTLWVILADVHQTGGSYMLMEQWMRRGINPASHVHNVDAGSSSSGVRWICRSATGAEGQGR